MLLLKRKQNKFCAFECTYFKGTIYLKEAFLYEIHTENYFKFLLMITKYMKVCI